MGVLIPVSVLWARFWKVAPHQDWPRQLDHKAWWHAHRTLQIAGVVVGIGALALVFRRGAASPAPTCITSCVAVVTAGLGQVLHGFARGSKGGPTDATLRGDHYDMTLRRVVFERVHKALGWMAVIAAIAAVASSSSSPTRRAVDAGDAGAVVAAARRGLRPLAAGRNRALDTYQAIRGPDPDAARQPARADRLGGETLAAAASNDGGKG